MHYRYSPPEIYLYRTPHPSLLLDPQNVLQWTDSDAWQPGYVQRLETAELVKMLMEERRNLQSVVDEAAIQSDRARELHGGVSRQESDLATTMEGVGALFSLLNSAHEDESFTKDPEAAAVTQTELEKEVLRNEHGGGEKMRRRRRRGSLQSVAARVRATSHRNRTPDEKRWVALDVVLNPGLYHHVTLAEAEEMRWDALYYTKLDREDTLRVLSLPPQVQLALPFLHTPHEVAAHELLARYSHGINADHFARIDKDSQDVRSRGMTIAFPSATSTGEASQPTAGAEVDTVSDGVPTPQGPATSTGDDTVVCATRRVLGCMQRAAEANLKFPAEQDDEEAVWCVLDTKLRPDLYRDSDEAAADRAEELHREADARGDARHTWLVTPSDTSHGVGAEKMPEIAGTGGGTTMGNVVQQKRKAEKDDEVVAAGKVLEEREALVLGVTNSFTEDDIKALAVEAAGESLGEGGLGPGAFAMTTATNREESTRQRDGGRERTSTPAGVNDGDVEGFALVTATRDAEKDTDGATPRQDDQGSKCDDDGHDEKAPLDMNGNMQQKAEERRRLVETVKRALSRFLVAEEETPLGREMTRSLAMLQEVTLRLEKGQQNVFSGLNPQSALRMLRSRWQSSKTVPSTAEEHSTAPATSAAGDEREEGERAVVGEAIRECKNEEKTAIMEAAVTAPQEGAEDAATSVVANKVKSNNADTKQRVEDETKSTSESGARRGGEDSGDGRNVRVANSGGGSMTSETPRKLEKVFGSWEEIHPAALGIGSQEAAYFSVEGKEVHPASFRSVSSKGTQNLNASSSFFTICRG